MADGQNIKQVSKLGFGFGDHVLINALIAALAPELGETSQQELARVVIGDILPFVNESHPHMARLVGAAGALNVAFNDRGPSRRKLIASAEFAARSALTDFAMWRMGEALERHNLEQGEDL